MVGDASSHSGRNPQSLVDSGKIVVHEVKRDHMPVIVQLFAESVRQAGKAPIGHPHCETLPSAGLQPPAD